MLLFFLLRLFTKYSHTLVMCPICTHCVHAEQATLGDLVQFRFVRRNTTLSGQITDMRDPPSQEESLHQAALAGVAKAWEQLYRGAFPSVQRYIRWRCGTQHSLAEEVQQETWLLAVRKLGSFNPKRGCFEQWVCGLAGQLTRNALRKQRRYQALLQRNPLNPNGVPVASHDPDRIAYALVLLPQKYELVLRLKYLEDWPVAQIAVQLQTTEKAVESLLVRARQAFREVYQHDA